MSVPYHSFNLGSIEIRHSYQRTARSSPFCRIWTRFRGFKKTLLCLLVFIAVTFVFVQLFFLDPNNQNIFSESIDVESVLLKNKAADPASNLLLEKILKANSKQPITFRGPTNERQKKIVEMFLHAWNAYKTYSWGQDELRPITKRSSVWFNLGLTIIDSLDTMYIMNLKEQYQEARQWINEKLDFRVDRYNNLFELTIRILGGLLSTYHLTGDAMYLEKSVELGNRLLPAFKTKSSIPFSDVNLKLMKGRSPHWTSDSSTSEVATIQLEFKELSRLTGDDRYATTVNKISKLLHDKTDKYDGLVPIYINTQSGSFVGSTFTLGARGDSYYEYLLKQWIQTGGRLDEQATEVYLLKDWLESVEGVKRHLVAKSKPNNLTFIAEYVSGRLSRKMDHLVCFYPGNLALGYMFLKERNYELVTTKENLESLLDLAKELTESCYQIYTRMRTGLSPEIVHFFTNDNSDSDIFVNKADRHNLLRPETVESLYYMYKITKEKKYQDYGWHIAMAFERYTRVESGGYTSIDDVTNEREVRPRDKMESFFLAETLKYLYLLFEDDETENVDLKKFVFNTEAHLVPIVSTAQ